jgi:hypothetical protein
MAREFTIAELILKGRRACDQEDSDELTAAEWQDEFSSVYADFQKAILDGGARMFEGEQTITADGNRNYALPSDFQAEIGVEFEESSTRRIDLHPLHILERSAALSATGRARYYSIINDANTRLDPAPSSGTYYLTYIKQPTDYSESATSTSVNVIVPAGEQFFKYSLGAVGAAKVGDDQLLGYLESKADRAKNELIKWSYMRSLTQPRRKIVGDHPLDGYEHEEGDWGY